MFFSSPKNASALAKTFARGGHLSSRPALMYDASVSDKPS
jgi:hypothetical protein